MRIMRLEPIAEGTPQHASGGARRASFQHEMFSIKKVCRVTRIEWHWREARQRREYRSRPFPPVSYQIVNSKCARSLGMGSTRRGVKIRKIKVTESRLRQIGRASRRER